MMADLFVLRFVAVAFRGAAFGYDPQACASQMILYGLTLLVILDCRRCIHINAYISDSRRQERIIGEYILVHEIDAGCFEWRRYVVV